MHADYYRVPELPAFVDRGEGSAKAAAAATTAYRAAHPPQFWEFEEEEYSDDNY